MRPEDEASEPAPGTGQKPRYEVMVTPSFTPGPDESPLMTWGDLAGTPLRLEAEDDIHVSAGEAGKLCSSSCCVGTAVWVLVVEACEAQAQLLAWRAQHRRSRQAHTVASSLALCWAHKVHFISLISPFDATHNFSTACHMGRPWLNRELQTRGGSRLS